MKTLGVNKIGNYTLNVGYDENPENPREFDDVSIIYSNHRRINPDNHNIEELLDEDGYLDMKDKVGLMIWLFEHSSYVFKTTELDASNPFGNGVYARFDSGQFGVIAMDIDEAKKQFGDEWETRAKQYMENAIKSYNAYTNGEVYAYEIVANNDDEVLESVGGFEDMQTAIEYGEDAAEFYNECDKINVDNILKNPTLDELKNKYYSLVGSAPIWVDELWDMIDEDKAKAWLVEQLKALIYEG